MPVRKPSAMHTRHSTKAEKTERNASEEAVTPKTGLPLDAPSFFAGKPTAEKIYRRVMKYYSEIEAVVVTRLDQDLLVNYCELLEELGELRQLRATMMERVEKAIKDGEAENEQGYLDNLIKLDGRIDRKKALIHQYAQSLYLTPRARAGVAPVKKEAEEAPDELEQLLGDVGSYLNDGKR